MNSLNDKIKSSSDDNQKRAVVSGSYGYNDAGEVWNKIRINDNKELVVTPGNSDSTAANQILQYQMETQIATSVDSIDNKTPSQYGNSQVLLTSAGGTAVKADSTCSILEDVEGRPGWNITNPVVNTKFNLYYFNGAQETLRLGDVLSIYAVGAVNVNSENSSVPFFHIYTKPTGVNDVSWYHSKIDYLYNNDNTIGIGEDCVFYGEGLPSSNFSQRKIQFNNKVVTGEGLPAEDVLYMVCGSNSGATVNSKNITLNTLGFNTALLSRNLKLEVEASTGGDLATETTLDNFKIDNASNLGAIDSSIGDVSTNQTNGNQQSKCMGLSGTSQVQLKCDVNGVLETSGGGGGGGSSVVQILGSEDGTQSGIQHQVRVGDDGRTESIIHGTNSSGVAYPVSINTYTRRLAVQDACNKWYSSTPQTPIIPANTADYLTPTRWSHTTYRSIDVYGTTTNTTDPLYLNVARLYAGPYYKLWEDPIYADPNTGVFYKNFPNVCGAQLKWSKANTTNVDDTIMVLAAQMD